MSARAVSIERIEIIRALGLRIGEGFVLDGLSPGINLICGSNGSGKSTTALVIQDLLWPRDLQLPRPTIAGTLLEGERRWIIDVDAGSVTTHRDDDPVAPPSFSPMESRARHHLALHELIVATDDDFATRIARERRGGFDLDRAAQDLSFTAAPSFSRNATRAVTEAKSLLRDAQRTQDSLVARERELTLLHERYAAARDAARRLGRLEHALQWRLASDDVRRLTDELAALPEGVRAMTGEESTQLDEIDARLAKIETSLREHQQERDDAEEAVRRARLPETGVDAAALATWRVAAESLRRIESELAQRDAERVRAESVAARRRAQIGDEVEPDALAAIDDDTRRAASAIGRESAELAAATDALEARERLLASASPTNDDDVPDADTLREAISALGQWLSSPAPQTAATGDDRDGALRIPLIIAAALMALLLVILAIVAHWAWIFGVVVPASIVVWTTIRTSATTQRSAPITSETDERLIARRNFERLGVAGPARSPIGNPVGNPIGSPVGSPDQRPPADPPGARSGTPVDWTPETVANRLRELQRTLAGRERDDLRRKELHALRAERDALISRKRELEKRREQLESTTGIPIGVDPNWLEHFVDTLRQWQESAAEAEAAAAEVARLAAVRREMFDRLRAELAPLLGAGEHAASTTTAPVTIASGDEALALIDSIGARQQQRQHATEQIARAGRAIAALTTDRGELRTARNAIFSRLGLDDGDRDSIEAMKSMLDRRRTIESSLHGRRAVRDAERSKLLDDDEGLAMDEEAIRRAIQVTTDETADSERLHEEITRITEQVDRAKEGQVLAECLAARDAALATLEDERERALEQVTGNRIIDFVRGVDADRSRPIVERRAAELLATFTHGALTLQVDDHDGVASFRARRGSRPPQPLDELSRGERIQTLMAVRLAFLEQEESARLPLILDETLATSDDRRTGTIIDTVIEIARSGRQVFCFTAQHDEVAKWMTRLDGSDVAFHHVDLDAVRGHARVAAFPIAEKSPVTAEVPAPGDDDHLTYGRRLSVPGIDPWDEAQDSLHPWYLIDDLESLHRCLAAGVASWQQLRTLLSSGASWSTMLGLDESLEETIRTRARLHVHACELWRIGRAAAIDRGILESAEGVTTRFLDRVVELSAEGGHDAATLIDRLRNGDLKGWRREKTEPLRDWLIERGHLAEAPRLERDQLRVRLLARCERELLDGVITPQEIDQVLARLPR